MERPLSHADIRMIADYLYETDESLAIAMSELGFDPDLYGKREVRRWLSDEAGLVQCEDTYIWRLT